MKNLKVGIVIGEAYHPRMIFAFEPLVENHTVNVYVIQRDNILSNIPNSFKTHLFKGDEQAPGYIRNLEGKLSENDVIISMNFGSLSSLQAARVAKEQEKPFYCFATDYDLSIFRNYHNIRSVQEFLISEANSFIVPNRQIMAEFVKYGVDRDRMVILPPRVNLRKFNFSAEKRNKFRQYIRVAEQDKVILFHQDLEKNEQAEIVLKAVKILEKLNKPVFENMKIIYLGDGSYSKDLQYLSYKLGLGNSTYFLNQDTEPFLVDLFCASDFIVRTKSLNRDKLPSFPFFTLESMACGVIPLIDEGSCSEMLLNERSFIWSSNNYETLSIALSRIVHSNDETSRLRNMVKNKVVEMYDEDKCFDILENIVVPIKKSRVSMEAEKGIEIPWSTIEEQVKESQNPRGAIAIITQLWSESFSKEDKSNLKYYLAEAYMSLHCYEEASHTYEESLKYNDKNVQAFIGQGYLSWYSYSHEEALSHFKQGLALSPNNWECMLGIGLVYKRIAMLDDAIYWIEKSIVMGAENGVAMKAMIQACNESEDLVFAIASLERVLEITGEDPLLMRGLGQIYLKAGLTDIGHEILNKYLYTPNL